MLATAEDFSSDWGASIGVSLASNLQEINNYVVDRSRGYATFDNETKGI